MKQTVLLTGISSFTGCHISRHLTQQGFHVIGGLTQSRQDYTSPILKARLEYSLCKNFLEKSSLASPHLNEFIKKHPIDYFINHGWPVIGHRETLNSPLEQAKAILGPIEALLKQFQSSSPNLKVVHTGTVFEQGEGGSKDNIAVNDYGKIKSYVWQQIQLHCKTLNISLSKVVLPNPIGPYEKSTKLISSFVNNWQNGNTPHLNRPFDIQDHLPIEAVGPCYLQALQDNQKVFRPSGWIASNQELVQVFASQHSQPYHFSLNSEQSERIERTNALSASTCSQQEFQDFANDWLQKGPFF